MKKDDINVCNVGVAEYKKSRRKLQHVRFVRTELSLLLIELDRYLVKDIVSTFSKGYVVLAV